MRPIRLTMQAFGPYAKKETIDFGKLGNRTMFVISGKTGSGKTTIFDGISYAIYGKASGEDRNGADLRSHFADNDTLTELTLEFTLRGKTYFIKRSPQQEKKKARGEGTTTTSAKAELYIYTENGELRQLASSLKEVDEKIKEIMIIDSNQFRQILMIPQGEFRKLLTSDSRDKEIILQRLFHTHFYKQIEEKLKVEAVNLQQLIKTQMDMRSLAFKKIKAKFNKELLALTDAGSTNDLIIYPLLLEEIVEMEAEIARTELLVNEKELLRNHQQKKLYDEQKLLEQFKMKDEAGQKLLQLEQQVEKIDHKHKELALGQKALLLVQQENLCTRLKDELTRLEREETSFLAKAEDIEHRIIVQQQRLSEEKQKEAERKSIEEKLHFLRSIEAEILRFATYEKEINALKNQIQQSDISKQKLELKMAENAQYINNLTEKKMLLEKKQLLHLEISHQLGSLTRYLEELNQVKKHVNLVESEKKRLVSITEQLEHKNNRYLDHLATFQFVEEKWFSGQAATLALNLQEGNPCSVCGSIHHPNPAAGFEIREIPSEEDLKIAKKELEKVEQEKREIELVFYKQQSISDKEHSLLHHAVETVLKTNNDFSLNDLDLNIVNTNAKYKEYNEQQKQLAEELKTFETIVQNLLQLDAEQSKLTEHLQVLSQDITDLKIKFAEKNTSFTSLQERIPEPLRDMNKYQMSVKETAAQLKKLAKMLDEAQLALNNVLMEQSNVKGQLENVRHQKEIKEKELKSEREQFITLMNENGFATYQDYQKAKKTESELLHLEQEIKEFREALRSANDRYRELSESLKESQLPDLVQTQAVITELNNELAHLDLVKNELIFMMRENVQVSSTVQEINNSMKHLEKRYKVIGHLADISKGNNHLKVSFERYVLAAFLDDILKEANHRLLKMTSGRFILSRKTDKSKGNAQSGLELLVMDSYTGQERHVKTLSGGESFKAALSLALGLADVVQAYAGGVSLETMFIDEGFGTLDPESLDQAVEALIDIQSSGRLVGIISHVPELKERIDARLEVLSSQSGSTTKFYFA